MTKIQVHNKMSWLRREHEKMMSTVTASKYDLATFELDEEEEKLLKSQIQHQQWAADDILERIKYNAEKFRRERARCIDDRETWTSHLLHTPEWKCAPSQGTCP